MQIDFQIYNDGECLGVFVVAVVVTLSMICKVRITGRKVCSESIEIFQFKKKEKKTCPTKSCIFPSHIFSAGGGVHDRTLVGLKRGSNRKTFPHAHGRCQMFEWQNLLRSTKYLVCD